MNIRILFLCKLVVFSLVLFLCMDWIRAGYQAVQFMLTSLFLSTASRPVTLDYTSYLRTIPFMALMLATPTTDLRRKLIVICAGLAAFLVIDVLCTVIWGHFPTGRPGAVHIVFSLVWKVTGQWILPFLFWFIAVRKDLSELFAEPASAG